MSKTDTMLLEHNFDNRNAGRESFQIYQCGILRDMRAWQHDGLGGPYWRFYHHLGTGSSIRVNRRRIPLEEEEIVLIPENTRFCSRGAHGVRHFWIHFSPPLQSRFPSRVLRLPITSGLRGLLEEWRPLIPASNAKMRWRLFHTSLALLHASFSHLPMPEPSGISPIMQGLLEEIERSHSAPLDNGTLARQAGRSIEGFIRWFHAEVGVSPQRYVMERRIHQACRQLSLTDLSIEEIADAVGFTNRHHFTRVFTRIAGQPPAQFRSQRRWKG